MTTSRVTLTVDQWAMQMQQLGPRFNAAALKGARRGALRVQSLMQRMTSRAPPANARKIGPGGAVNTGHFKRSWKWEGLKDGARVFNDAIYASVIEDGRRAGSQKPPILDLTNWAQRRLGLSREEASRAAYAIARAIQRRGLLPRRIMGSRLNEIKTMWILEINKVLAQELAKP